jgi:hypothetical protein
VLRRLAARGALPVRDRHRARPVSPVEEIDRGVEIVPAVAVAVAVAAPATSENASVASASAVVLASPPSSSTSSFALIP